MPELEMPELETSELETPGASSRRRPAGPEQAVPRDAYCLLKREVERAGCFAPTPWRHLGDPDTRPGLFSMYLVSAFENRGLARAAAEAPPLAAGPAGSTASRGGTVEAAAAQAIIR